MTLLAPLGLFALLSLPLIVFLHLMREQRRRVVVPSLVLWQQLPQRQPAQRRRRLPLTLLLLFHLLVAALLALALAAPQWLASLFGGRRHVVLVVDTSASMAAPAGGLGQGSRLDMARTRAQSLIHDLGGINTLTLIAAGSEARMLDSASQAGASRLLAALDHLQAGSVGSDLAGALTLAAADLQGQSTGQVIVITDAALPALDSDLRHIPQGLAISWEQVGAAIPNRALITLAAAGQAGGGLVQVYARAANYGGAAIESVVRLYGDDQLLDTRTVSFPAQGELELTWSIPPGIAILRAELDGADRMPADDTALLSLATTRPLRTLLVSANPVTLGRALRVIPGMQIRQVEPGTYLNQERLDIDLTIFDGVLPASWPAGAVLVVNPPSGHTLLAVNELPSAAMPAARELHSTPGTTIFDELSLGGVDFGPIRQISPPEWAQVLLWRGEAPLILRGSLDQSGLAIWAFDPGQGNLSSRLAFPLLLARTLRDLVPAGLPASLLAGQPLVLRPDLRADTIELTAPDGGVSRVATASGIVLPIRLEQPGIYQLRELAGDTAIVSGQLAVNVGSSRESDLTPRALPAATVAAPQLSEVAHTEQPLWPGLVVLALVVMFAEWIYLHGHSVRV